MKTFEEYLKELHQDIFFDVLADELPDSFDNWVSTMDTDEMIKYAQDFNKEQISQILLKIYKFNVSYPMDYPYTPQQAKDDIMELIKKEIK